ncbi:MAG: VOC family protein [Planctomycetota bacterium]
MGYPVVHFEIGCRDNQKTRAFYCDLFGWTAEPGEMSTELTTGAGGGINGMLTTLGHEPHNYTNIYVSVDDIDAVAQKAESLGGTILIPRTEIPGGKGEFAWIADPEGTTIGLYRSPE